MSSVEEQIFKRGSTTYYASSRFFPRATRQDVFKLYSFVRVADDFVDAVPQDKKAFIELKTLWAEVQNTGLQSEASASHRVAQNMQDVAAKYDIDPAWVASFLDAMQADLHKKTYKTLDDSLAYVYGSAEVIGLMMAKVMALPEESYEAARLQGRAMQWINFIRDISEDNGLGRCYFPQADLKKFGLKDLSEKTAMANQTAFKNFMHFQLTRYAQWQQQANEGYNYIPKRLRIALKTARDMYNYTSLEIAKDPLIVFEKKVKPRKRQVIMRGVVRKLRG